MRDPRLIEVELLSAIDQATYDGGGYQYHPPGQSGGDESHKRDALLHLMFEGAVIRNAGYEARRVHTFPNPSPNAAFPVDAAAAATVDEFLAMVSMRLIITQRGRLRLYRLRDEILNRDRIRDELGLWDKRHFERDLEVQLRFLALGGALSLLLLDVDRLKMMNTEFGHPKATDILREMFQLLQAAVDPGEAYRVGGDEAAAILPGADIERAGKIAEDLRATVERTFATKIMGDAGATPTVSIAIGMARPGMTARELYEHFDAALVEGKDRGGQRNRVFRAMSQAAGR